MKGFRCLLKQSSRVVVFLQQMGQLPDLVLAPRIPAGFLGQQGQKLLSLPWGKLGKHLPEKTPQPAGFSLL